MKRAGVLVVLALSGCGLGIHINSTAATTAPYHDHQSTIKGFDSVHASARSVSMPGVAVGPFARYYAVPVGFWIGKGRGAMRSWGRGSTLTWAPYEPKAPPEQEVQAAFTTELGGGAADGELMITGVVTDVSFYVNEGTNGGRITTRVVVVRKDGTPVFEGERSTTGQAKDLEELVAAHVDRWLADPELVAVLQKGGAR